MTAPVRHCARCKNPYTGCSNANCWCSAHRAAPQPTLKTMDIFSAIAAVEEAGDDDIDMFAVECAVEGQVVKLTVPERREAVRALAAQHKSDTEIAEILRVKKDTVCSDRRRANIPAGVPATNPVIRSEAESAVLFQRAEVLLATGMRPVDVAAELRIHPGSLRRLRRSHEAKASA